jgi:hypothetical protein
VCYEIKPPKKQPPKQSSKPTQPPGNDWLKPFFIINSWFIIGKPKPSASSTPAGPGNHNQGGCKTVVCKFVSSVKNILSTFTANTNRPNNNNDQRPKPTAAF